MAQHERDLLAIAQKSSCQRAGVTKRFVRGARQVAGGTIAYCRGGTRTRPVLVDGAVGIAAVVDDRVVSVLKVTVTDGLIATIDITADTDRAVKVDLTFLEG